MSWRDRLTDAKRHILVTALTTALTTHHGNRTATARALGIQRGYLYRLLRAHGLEHVGRG